MTRFRPRAAWRGLLLLAAVPLLSSCTSALLPGAHSEPPTIYVLTPKSTFPADLPKVDWQLTIFVPTTDAALNTARIAVRRSPISLEYYAHANWVDTAPQMVQSLLVESFENSGKIVSVGRQSLTLRADYSLLTDLREFQAEYSGDGPPRVHVAINAKLIRMPQREIIAHKNFDFVEPAPEGDLKSVVGAFDVALGKTLKRIVAWTLTAVPPESPRQRH